MAYYDDLKTKAESLKADLDAVAATKVSPIVQELVNASDHVEAILTRIENVKVIEESPEEEPGR